VREEERRLIHYSTCALGRGGSSHSHRVGDGPVPSARSVAVRATARTPAGTSLRLGADSSHVPASGLGPRSARPSFPRGHPLRLPLVRSFMVVSVFSSLTGAPLC